MKPGLSFLYIYLTDECNLNCIHCWQSAPLAGKGNYSQLNFDECKSFLNDTVEMGLKNITFSGGEPLLNPGFHKFAEYFYKKNIFMAIETNGILIHGEILDTIKNFDVFCAISLDGFNPGTHNKQRGRKDAYEKTLISLHRLEEAKIHYQLIMAVSKFNYHELIPLLDLVKKNFKYCIEFKINIIKGRGRGEKMGEKDLLFKAEEFPQISEQVAALLGNYPFKILLHVVPVFVSFKNFKMKFSCGGNCGYNTGLSILSNGNISICSLGKQVEKYIFGKVSTIDVKDVWANNKILNDIHEDIHKKLEGICSNCIFRKQCVGGCRAEALCTYGDLFAPNPECQSYYDSGLFPKSRLINVAN